PAGATPWLAGGGATVRGVPEKNSIAPFVLSTDRDGKPLTYQGRRGTYAVMGDGSVRFIDEKISDEVLKGMVTINGPAPNEFDAKLGEWAPLVADPKVKGPAPKGSPSKDASAKEPPAKEEPKGAEG